MPVFEDVSSWPRRPADLPRVARPDRVLLADPEHFRVVEAINVHMCDAEGRPNRVDPAAARREWEAMRAAYEELGVEVAVVEPPPEWPDACYVANPALVLPLPDGRREAWSARMVHRLRRDEPRLVAEALAARGLVVRELPDPSVPFEGTGDGHVHPGRFLLHGGYGQRTERAAWEAIAAAHPDLDVLVYRLVDERFYHLDTAVAPLTETTALYVREAFDDAGLALLRAAFPDALEVPLDEALRFACNAFSPDGRHVLIERTCTDTRERLEEHGFVPVPLDTSEFRKGGGSVFCLKLAF